MRVLLVNDYAPGEGGGTEVHLQLLADGLRESGDDVELFAGSVRHRGVARALDLWDPSARRALRRLSEEFAPDVVHYHHVVRELSASVFGAPRGVARVLTLHDLRLLGRPEGPEGAPVDSLPMRSAKMAKASFERAIARRTIDAAIAPSEAMAAGLRAAGFRNVTLVRHFLPPGPEPASPPSACTDVVFAGRLAAEKGVEPLIGAFARVAGAHLQATLVIAGDGPEREAYESLAGRLAPGRVRFVGQLPHPDVRALMAGARVVAAPTLAPEAFALTMIEAAFAGRPVVASEDPAQRELAALAPFAVLVGRGDVAALADGLDALLSDAARADRLGAAGRVTALESFTPAVGVAQTRDVYRAARERARRAPSGVR
jgi:glycosyltransferase involved in cell wall biosynthesis